jgi:hypothetical protein
VVDGTANPTTWWVVDHVVRVEATDEQIQLLAHVLRVSYGPDQVVTVTSFGHTLIRLWARADNEEFALRWAQRAIEVVFPYVGILTRCAVRVERPGDIAPAVPD